MVCDSWQENDFMHQIRDDVEEEKLATFLIQLIIIGVSHLKYQWVVAEDFDCSLRSNLFSILVDLMENMMMMTTNLSLR